MRLATVIFWLKIRNEAASTEISQKFDQFIIHCIVLIY